MIKLGISGGIGSGKSVVSRLLSVMGIPVYIADIEAKRLTATDPAIRRELISLLGEEVFENGVLNKAFLASRIFSDKDTLTKVNHIIHPRVKADFREWAQKNSSCPIIAMESAILIEAGFKDEVDKLVLVYAPLSLRVERAMKRDGATSRQVMERINNQMSDEQKKQYADVVINNDEESSLLLQVQEMLHSLNYH